MHLSNKVSSCIIKPSVLANRVIVATAVASNMFISVKIFNKLGAGTELSELIK